MATQTSTMMKILFGLFQWIYSKIMVLIYSGTPKTIPTILNYILMENASSLASRIRKQKVTSTEVVESYIKRIQEVNDILNCVVDVRFEDALNEANKVDELIKSGEKTEQEIEKEFPLLGVPFTASETIEIKALHNTNGVLSRKEEKADADSEYIKIMKSNGAIPLAVTNVAESGFAFETENLIFGRTCNPYDTNRSAGGPAGGESSLIASCGSPVGIAKSLRLPCAFNGTFGHQPSVQTPGPISRNSVDLLPILKIITKNHDLQLDEPVDIKAVKYYYTESNETKEIQEALKKVAEHLKYSLKTSVEKVELRMSKDSFDVFKKKTNDDRIKEAALNKLNLRKEIMKYWSNKSEHSLTFLLTALVERHIYTTDITDDKCNEFSTELQALLGSNGVLIAATYPTQPFRHNESIVKGFDIGKSGVFESLGLPITFCPVGLDSDGFPISLQIVGGKNQDRITIAVARELEKAFGGWKPPPTHGMFTLKNTVFHSLSNDKVKTL